jgi:hypothetical protein
MKVSPYSVHCTGVLGLVVWLPGAEHSRKAWPNYFSPITNALRLWVLDRSVTCKYSCHQINMYIATGILLRCYMQREWFILPYSLATSKLCNIYVGFANHTLCVTKFPLFKIISTTTITHVTSDSFLHLFQISVLFHARSMEIRIRLDFD